MCTGTSDRRMAELGACRRFLPDMFILKLAILTCAFYIGITVLLLLGGLVVVHWKGMIAYNYNFRAWAILFGLMWFVSFIGAWRIVIQQGLNAFKSD
jgi:hypothetical protein